MRSRLATSGLFCLHTAALLALFAVNATAEDLPTQLALKPWRVVVVYGTDFSLPALVTYDQAMRQVLQGSVKRPIDLHTETLDAQRFGGVETEAAFLDLLQAKYRSLKVDLVVTQNEFALNFAERYRQQLWPGARIVFGNVPDHVLWGRTLAAGDVGIPIRFDFEGTLALARRLQPDARRVVIVGGASNRDRLWRRSAADIARRELPGLQVEEIPEASLAQMLDTLRAIPADSIVYVTTFFRDATGNGYVPREVARQAAAASPAPVYSHHGTFLGQGLVGGAAQDEAAEGRRLGSLVLAILSQTGTPPNAVVAATPSRCAVDWRQLERWKIPERKLPEGCAIEFRPTSLWQVYRYYIVLMAAVIILQAALIAALLFQRRRRHSAEAEVGRRRSELARAARLATVGELSATISHEVNQPLGAILSNADAAEFLLDSKNPKLDEIRNILKDIRREDLRASRVVLHIRKLLSRQPSEMVDIDIETVISDAMSVMAPEAHRRGVALASGVITSGLTVRGDRTQLQQVLVNLLINAMDAVADVPRAEREVSIEVRTPMEGFVAVVVSDTGPGIPDEHLEGVFDTFFTTKADGMGLGLSLVRMIVEAHRGRVTARNRHPRGAEFTVLIPRTRESDDSAASVPRAGALPDPNPGVA